MPGAVSLTYGDDNRKLKYVNESSVTNLYLQNINQTML